MAHESVLRGGFAALEGFGVRPEEAVVEVEVRRELGLVDEQDLNGVPVGQPLRHPSGGRRLRLHRPHGRMRHLPGHIRDRLRRLRRLPSELDVPGGAPVVWPVVAASPGRGPEKIHAQDVQQAEAQPHHHYRLRAELQSLSPPRLVDLVHVLRQKHHVPLPGVARRHGAPAAVAAARFSASDVAYRIVAPPAQLADRGSACGQLAPPWGTRGPVPSLERQQSVAYTQCHPPRCERHCFAVRRGAPRCASCIFSPVLMTDRGHPFAACFVLPGVGRGEVVGVRC
mmetsp:Transcript_24553/g.76988  ORF Transcript_24553/g.76988 Transcript_24553/m.76988 type:complete len:283 (-) Transcript_24553:43-891(-)